MSKYIVTRRLGEDSGIDPRIVAYYDPDSRLSEQFRAIRASLKAGEKGLPRILMVTSSVEGEGKSVTAANLAVAMCEESDKKILLLDLNLRSPVLASMFNIPVSPGFNDCMKSGLPLTVSTKKTSINNLFLIPSGDQSHHSSEYISRKDFQSQLDCLRKDYDCVIIDTPAAGPFADAGIIAPLTEGVIIVVRAEKTRREVVRRTIEQINNSGAQVTGAVLAGMEYHIPEYIHRHL